MNGRKLYTIPRMMAYGVLMISRAGRCRKLKTLLMTPFFSSSVCHARVRRRKFIHIGRIKISTIKLVWLTCVLAQDHCQRIGKDQTDHGTQERQKNGHSQSLQILRCRDLCQSLKIVKVPSSLVKRITNDHEQRDHDKGYGPEQIRSGKQTLILQCLPPPHLRIPVFS